MGPIARVYIECCGALEREPDHALVNPIEETFSDLQMEAMARDSLGLLSALQKSER
jgi:hypothetical protein